VPSTRNRERIRALLLLFAIVASPLSTLHCQWLGGLQDVHFESDATTDGSRSEDANGADGRDDGAADALRDDAGDAAPDVRDAAPAECTALDGTTPMALVVIEGDGGRYCIDTHEVTNGQFSEFLRSDNSVPSELAANGFIPAVCTPAIVKDRPQGYETAPQEPAGGMTWCWAYAYCKWAKKHLCGAFDGGREDDSATSQWAYACRNGRFNWSYPYGNAYNAAACNTTGTGSADVGSYRDCHGKADSGFAAISDMIGNVAEYVDIGTGLEGDATPWAYARGGYWDVDVDSGASADCTCGEHFGIDTGFSSIGFRCCADSVP
jgi:formylglycine-generating enzyme required for sulfatase activity